MSRVMARVMGIAVLAIAALSFQAAMPVVEAAAAPSGQIEIRFETPPGAPEPTFRLVSGGTDVTDTCRQADPSLGVDLSCSGLSNGTYAIEVVDVPDGWRSSVNCIDEVANRSLSQVELLDGVGWTCSIFAGTPAVLLTLNGTTGVPAVDGGVISLEPVAGVTPDCIDDVTNGSAATRCQQLPLGAYEVVVSDVPDGAVVSEPFCQSQVFDDSLEYAAGPVATLTDDRWLWWCDAAVAPSAIISLTSLGGETTDIAALGLRVSGEGGDVTSKCALVSGADPTRREWSCRLDIGSYDVAFEGVSPADVTEACRVLDITGLEQVSTWCQWTVGAVLPTTTLPVTEPGDFLPPTGWSSVVAARLASSIALLGILLVVVSRRRVAP